MVTRILLRVGTRTPLLIYTWLSGRLVLKVRTGESDRMSPGAISIDLRHCSVRETEEDAAELTPIRANLKAIQLPAPGKTQIDAISRAFHFSG